ncbi:MAG: DUF1292 domain-containing protein [Lachnospiraceae bacterium]|nr:DUF1292 domain-containing protein [Lachnospiraceae bacterium]
MEDRIEFITEEGERVSLYVLEQTRINNTNYLLTADSLEDESNAYILKDTSAPEDEQSLYQMIEDEDELRDVGRIFEELLEDIELR